jgi:ABC-type nitrate/sulfonate/bicarbonate transport system permease component
MGGDASMTSPATAWFSAARARRRPPSARRALIGVLNTVGVLVVLVVVWEVAATLGKIVFFPPPSKIVTYARTLFFGGSPETLFLTEAITVDAAATIGRVLLGFALGALGGIVIGTIVGRSIAAREFSDPIVEFLRSIPATATLPLFIILLGGGDGMRVAFIAYGVSWFVLINTAAGVSSIHRTALDMGQIFRLPRRRVLFGIILPAAAPKIFAGLRISLTGALLLAVVSEFILATNGIGYQLLVAQSAFAINAMWSWMLLLAVLGFLLNTILEAIETRLLAWDRMARTAA